jgi:uncharacterized protein (TIGR03083 family)
MSEPVVDLLAEEWASIADLCATLSDEEWDRPTDLPGWTVRDNVSHIIGTERALAGDAPPDVEIGEPAHVKNPIGAGNEKWVAARRSRPGAEVLAEFREVTGRRLEQLRNLGEEEWNKLGFTPVGEAPYRTFMDVRVFDCWAHEQDIRRAVGKPGHTEGPVVQHSLGRIALAMPMVVGKRAGAPDGSTVVIDPEGAAPLAIGVEGGRAKVLDAVPADPTVRLVTDAETYWCLGFGRVDGQQALDEGRVRIDGDEALGRKIVTSMNFMI